MWQVVTRIALAQFTQAPQGFLTFPAAEQLPDLADAVVGAEFRFHRTVGSGAEGLWGGFGYGR